MQQAWMIGPFVIKIALLVLVISIVVGFIFFRVMSPFSKEQTKHRLEEMETLLFVFILSIWIVKILIRPQILVNDPIAALAHPSNSSAFYLGLLVTIIYSKWRIIKDKDHLIDILLSILYLFFASYFVYEFASMWLDGRNSLLSFSIFMIFFIFFISMQKRISNEKLITIIITGIGLSFLFVSFIQPTYIYQYTAHSWFWLIVSLFGFSLAFYLNRKRRIS